MPKYANPNDIIFEEGDTGYVAKPQVKKTEPNFVEKYVRPALETVTGDKYDGNAVTLQDFPSHVLKSAKNAAMFTEMSPIKLALAVGGLGLGAKALDSKNKLNKGDVVDSAVEGATAGALTKAIPFLGKNSAKLVGAIGSRLSGIEKKFPGLYQEVLNKVLNGEKVFGTSDALGKIKGDTFDRLKAKEIIAMSVKDNGLKNALKSTWADGTNLTNKIKKIVEDSMSSTSVSDLPKASLSFIDEISSPLKNRQVPATELDKLKNIIQDKINFNKITPTEGFSKGDHFLNNVAREIDSELQKVSPELYDANKTFSFAKKTDDAFKVWNPNIAPHHGSLLGLGTVAASGASGVPYKNIIEFLGPLIGLSSPKVNKGLIKAAGGISKGYSIAPNVLPSLLARDTFKELMQ